MWASLVAQTVKRLPTMRETRVQGDPGSIPGLEDPLEKEMATLSSILSWKIPWTEDPGRLQSMGSQRVRHDWATSLSLSCVLSFVSFPVCFKCQMTVEWSALNSLAASPVLLRGSVLMILSVGRCQLQMAGHCAPHLPGSRHLCKTSWITLHCMFISSSWAKCIVNVSCLHCFTTHFEFE